MKSQPLPLYGALLYALFSLTSMVASLQQRNSNDVIEYRVLEQQPSNSLIGNVLVDAHLHSIYSTQTLITFRFNVLSVTTASGSSASVSDDARSYFVVDPVNGLLRTSRSLDRELLCRPMSTYCAVQVDISVTPVQFFRVIRVIVNIDDLNDNSPTFDPSHINLSIYELSTIGSRFPLPTAFDTDSAANSIRDYQLHSSSASHPFRLLEVNATGSGSDSSSELYLILVGRLDREMTSSYSLTLTARDGGIPARTGVLSISIVVIDANDNPPVFDRLIYEFSVPENTPIGTTVVKVTAYDADEAENSRLVYGIVTSPSRGSTAHSPSMTSSPFAVNADTGHVILVTSLDRETNAELVIGVMATDSPNHGPPLSGYSRLVAKVTDVNDNAPLALVHALTPDGLIQVNENSPSGIFIAHISGTDMDEGLNGRVTCQLTAGMTEFQLVKIGDTEYKLVAGRQFDREDQDQYRVVVTCSDEGFPPLYVDTSLNVHIVDENDCSPKFSSDTYHVAVAENGPPGLMLTQLYAVDNDQVGPNSRLTYAIRPRTDPSQQSAVDISPDNGSLWTRVSFDYEVPSWPTEYIVTATDEGLPTPLTGTATLYVTITDVQDNRPIFVASSSEFDTNFEIFDSGYHFDVSENQPAGTVIGRLKTRDADDPPYDRVRYRLTDLSDGCQYSYHPTSHPTSSPTDANVPFAVDSQTGDVTTLSPIDREAVDYFRFTAVAENPDFEETTKTFVNVTVRVIDVNDNNPVPLLQLQDGDDNGSTTICSSTVRGDWLLQLSAYDPDIGANGDVWYQLTEQVDERTGDTVNLFEVSSSDGWLLASRDLIRNTYDGQRFVLRIVLKDRGSPPLINDLALTLTIDDSRCTEPTFGDGGGRLRPQFGRTSWSRGAFVALVTVVSLLGVMFAVVIVSCAVVACRRRRRKDYQTHSQVIGNTKYDQVSSMASSAVTISRRRWTDLDRKLDSKHVLERLDRQQLHRTAMTSSVADADVRTHHQGHCRHHSPSDKLIDGQLDQTVDASHACFNIQHEFEIVWKSAASSSSSQQHPSRYVCVPSQVDSSSCTAAGAQHCQPIGTTCKKSELAHYIRRHSAADGKDRCRPYSDLLRHQLRQHDVTRSNRRPTSPQQRQRRHELWSDESWRQGNDLMFHALNSESHRHVDQVLPGRSSTTGKDVGHYSAMDPASDSGHGPSERSSSPSMAELSPRPAAATTAARVTPSTVANCSERDCCLATTAPRLSACRHQYFDGTDFCGRTPHYMTSLHSPEISRTDCAMCDLLPEQPTEFDPTDSLYDDDGRYDDVTTTSGSYVINYGDLECNQAHLTDVNKGLIV